MQQLSLLTGDVQVRFAFFSPVAITLVPLLKEACAAAELPFEMIRPV